MSAAMKYADEYDDIDLEDYPITMGEVAVLVAICSPIGASILAMIAKAFLSILAML